MISVKRNKDGKIFTTDMSARDRIYEMHFCTSYTQVMIHEEVEGGFSMSKEIICPAFGTNPNPIDLIAIQGDDTGVIL